MIVKITEHQGERDLNLDIANCFSTYDATFFIIADGYEESSEKQIFNCIQELSTEILNADKEAIFPSSLYRCVKENIKFSLTCCMVKNSSATLFHSGDCRLYINGELFTKDETVAWRAVSKRKSFGDTASTVINHPMRHVLTNYISKDNIEDINISEVQVSKGDKIILCTDGVWSLFHEHILTNSFDAGKIIGNLMDNGTVIEIIL